MRTGEVNANLILLNEEGRLASIADLIARKQSGCLRTATPPSKMLTWPFTSVNTSARVPSCSQRTMGMSCQNCRVMKRGRL